MLYSYLYALQWSNPWYDGDWCIFDKDAACEETALLPENAMVDLLFGTVVYQHTGRLPLRLCCHSTVLPYSYTRRPHHLTLCPCRPPCCPGICCRTSSYLDDPSSVISPQLQSRPRPSLLPTSAARRQRIPSIPISPSSHLHICPSPPSRNGYPHPLLLARASLNLVLPGPDRLGPCMHPSVVPVPLPGAGGGGLAQVGVDWRGLAPPSHTSGHRLH